MSLGYQYTFNTGALYAAVGTTVTAVPVTPVAVDVVIPVPAAPTTIVSDAVVVDAVLPAPATPQTLLPDPVSVEAIIPTAQVGFRFFTNFSEYTPDAAPGDWTEAWHTDGTPTVRDSGIPAGAGAQALQITRPSTERYALVWDLLTANGDVEVLAKFYTNPAGFGDRYFRIYLHVAGSGAAEDAYFVEFDSFEVMINKYVSGASTTDLDQNNVEPDEGIWEWVRLRREGDMLRTRWWDDGDTEPGTWDLEVEDTDLSSGQVGVGFFDGDTTDTWVDVFSAATGGLTAPDEDPSGAQPLTISVDAVAVDAVLPTPTVETAGIKPDAVVVETVIPDPSLVRARQLEPDAVQIETAFPGAEALVSPLLEPDTAIAEAVIGQPSVQLQVSPSTVAVDTVLPAASILVESWTAFGNIVRQIDPGDWPDAATFHFEAVIATTNAATTARARLYDVTNDGPVSGSEVTTTSTDPARLRSGALTLPDAAREYRAEIGANVGDDDVTCYAADVLAVVPSS